MHNSAGGRLKSKNRLAKKKKKQEQKKKQKEKKEEATNPIITHTKYKTHSLNRAQHITIPLQHKKDTDISIPTQTILIYFLFFPQQNLKLILIKIWGMHAYLVVVSSGRK